MYLNKTLMQLLEAYEFEMGRIDPKDRETTKRKIRQELMRRFNSALAGLEDGDTAQCAYNTIVR